MEDITPETQQAVLAALAARDEAVAAARLWESAEKLAGEVGQTLSKIRRQAWGLVNQMMLGIPGGNGGEEKGNQPSDGSVAPALGQEQPVIGPARPDSPLEADFSQPDPAQKGLKNQSADEAEFTDYQKVLGAENLPETFAEFQEMKYNEPDRFERMKRSYQTFAKINGRQWKDAFRDKVKRTYWEFFNQGIELSDHATERFLNRSRDVKHPFTREDIVKLMEDPPNYIQDDLRKIRYYNGIAVITDVVTGEVVTIVQRNHPKEEWRNLND